jgi:hypothetical protein
VVSPFLPARYEAHVNYCRLRRPQSQRMSAPTRICLKFSGDIPNIVRSRILYAFRVLRPAVRMGTDFGAMAQSSGTAACD